MKLAFPQLCVLSGEENQDYDSRLSTAALRMPLQVPKRLGGRSWGQKHTVDSSDVYLAAGSLPWPMGETISTQPSSQLGSLTQKQLLQTIDQFPVMI